MDPPSLTRAAGYLSQLAHAIRLLLEYTDSTPDYDRSQWLNEKFKLGLDFPNVGRQKRRRFVWTLWRTRPWTTICSWP
uniref:Glutathione S-transferase mu 1 n=1 Tax=Rhinopithecus roxellana TaxID=61622 RepID=A0A2K6PAP5_RHIRO